MKCDLLCTYNKHSKIFEWSDNNTDIVGIDELAQILIDYVKQHEKRKVIIFGYEACCKYIDYLKENIEVDETVNKDFFQPFGSLKLM